MEIKYCMLMSVLMFVMTLICIGLSVFYTFRIEKAYTRGEINGKTK